MFDEEIKAIRLLKNGLSSADFRRSFVILAKYFKYLGYNQHMSKDLILDWLEKQECSKEFNLVVDDLNKVIHNVYTKAYGFINDINVPITENEILSIKYLKSRGEQVIAFSLIYISKVYGSNFYCYHYTLHKFSGISVRQIKRIIHKLRDKKVIEITSNNKTKKIIMNSKRYSHPNKYKILIKSEGKIICILGNLDNIIETYNTLIK
jgi:hypothetical protein